MKKLDLKNKILSVYEFDLKKVLIKHSLVEFVPFLTADSCIGFKELNPDIFNIFSMISFPIRLE